MPAACFDHPVPKSILALHDNNVRAIRCDTAIQNTLATSFIGMLRREYQCRAFYKEALKRAEKLNKIDVAIIPTFDDVAISSSLLLPDFRNTPWLGIVMRQKFHFSSVGAMGPPDSKQLSIKQVLFIRLLKRLKHTSRIVTIDESLKHYISSNYPALDNCIGYAPDPVDDRRPVTKPALREELGIPEDAFVILAYGSLRVKKGVSLLLDVLHELPENVHALLVGSQDPEVKNCVNSLQHKPLINADRVHQVDRYIDVSEDPNFFTPANLIWLAYHNYYSMSAVMVQAAQYKKPTISTECGVIGFLTDRYKTGLVVDTSNTQDIKSAIHELMNSEHLPADENYESFSDDFSLAAFETAMLRSIDSIIGDTGR